MYRQEFFQALQRTEEAGFSTPSVEVDENNRYIDDEKLEEIQRLGLNSELTAEDLAFECVFGNLFFYDDLQEIFECDLHLTIGYLENTEQNKKHFFQKPEEILSDINSQGSFDSHVWYTLPSMEILDLTVASTYAEEVGDDRLYGSIFADHADEFSGFAFKPQFVGLDFLKGTGAIATFISNIRQNFSDGDIPGSFT